MGPCVRRDDADVITATAPPPPAAPTLIFPPFLPLPPRRPPPRGYPTQPLAVFARCHPSAPPNTGATAYGSLRPQGRRRCYRRDRHSPLVVPANAGTHNHRE